MASLFRNKCVSLADTFHFPVANRPHGVTIESLNVCFRYTRLSWKMLYIHSSGLCIHSWLLQPFPQGYGPSFSHNLLHNISVNVWWNQQSKSSDRLFEKFVVIILFILRVFARNLLRGYCRRNIFFHISFLRLTWDMNLDFMSIKRQ